MDPSLTAKQHNRNAKSNEFKKQYIFYILCFREKKDQNWKYLWPKLVYEVRLSLVLRRAITFCEQWGRESWPYYGQF